MIKIKDFKKTSGDGLIYFKGKSLYLFIVNKVESILHYLLIISNLSYISLYLNNSSYEFPIILPNNIQMAVSTRL